MSYNLAELFERVVDAVPDRVAVHTPARTLTYAELDGRANQLAHHLREVGVGRGDTIGLQLLNGTEYIEAMLAAFKLSAIPVNINYRYVGRELEHLFTNAELTSLVFHRQFAAVISDVLPSASGLKHLVAVEDGTEPTLPAACVDYEATIADSGSSRSWAGRSGDDLYMTYTGGTTGIPKAVVWRHEDLLFAGLGGGDPTGSHGPLTSPDDLPLRIGDEPVVMLVAPPLMHISGHWAALSCLLSGWRIVLAAPGPFDPHEHWQLIAEQRVHSIVLVGDAMTRPLLDALDPDLDTSSLLAIASGGAIMSPSTKAAVRSLLPNVHIVDRLGSSESGISAARSGDGTFRSIDDRTTVVDDDLRRVEPGSGQIGRVARRGPIPLRYHKDEAKTAATFVEFEGHRWAIPGDMATVAHDGTIELLGRGSGCINTGGEKVFPEEVEAVLMGHPDIIDVVVVGVPDERYGSSVAAVARIRDHSSVDLAEIQAHARADLAGYKIPRHLFVVDAVRRGPNGKADYPWAQAHAIEQVTAKGQR